MKRKIINIVCQSFGIKHADLVSKNRRRILVYARYAAVKLLYEYAQPISYTQIGEMLNISHSTAILGKRALETQLMNYDDFTSFFYPALEKVDTEFSKEPPNFTNKVISYLKMYKDRSVHPSQLPLIEDTSEAVQRILHCERLGRAGIRSLEPIV